LTLDCTRASTWCEIDAIGNQIIHSFYLILSLLMILEMEGKLPIDATQCEQDLANDLRKLLISKDFYDVEFEIEGKITGKNFIQS